MEKTIEQTVGRVIEAMRENLSESFTVDDMAHTAMYSKFHFSRLFQRVTGVSPGRLLAAMRMQEAKRLLVSTSLTVTEISHQVGYTSVGTFSSRFRTSVGVSPSTYRQLGGFTPLVGVDRPRAGTPRSVTLHGEVRSTLPDQLGLIFVGLFAEPVPEGQPVSCAVLHHAGPYTLTNVPHGTWYLLAHSVAAGLELAVSGLSASEQASIEETRIEQALCLGSHGPLKIGLDAGLDSAFRRADVTLNAVPGSLDPQVLQALLDLRSAALTVGAA